MVNKRYLYNSNYLDKSLKNYFYKRNKMNFFYFFIFSVLVCSAFYNPHKGFRHDILIHGLWGLNYFNTNSLIISLLFFFIIIVFIFLTSYFIIKRKKVIVKIEIDWSDSIIHVLQKDLLDNFLAFKLNINELKLVSHKNELDAFSLNLVNCYYFYKNGKVIGRLYVNHFTEGEKIIELIKSLRAESPRGFLKKKIS